MGKRADRNIVYARRGNRRDILQAYAAGGFKWRIDLP